MFASRAALLLLVILACTVPAGVTGQEPFLAAVVGTLNWSTERTPGTALMVVTRGAGPPSRPSSLPTMGGSFTLLPPRVWDDKPVSLYARFAAISDFEIDHHVFWYLWPNRPPAVGDYVVQTRGREPDAGATAVLGEINYLRLPVPVRVERISRNEFRATWPAVPGAASYFVQVVQRASEPLDAPGLTHPDQVLTTQASATLRYDPASGMVLVRRVEVLAFNVDFTVFPLRLPRQFNVSWGLSGPFEIPPSIP